MKKGFILIASMLFLAASGLSAAVSVERDGDQVYAIFTYEDQYAGSVGVVGDFNGWDLAAATPMTKGDGDVWSLRMAVREDATIIYKFAVDGEWTEDPTAPATQDDGFGGLNGTANIALLLASNEGREIELPGLTFGNYTSLRVVTQIEDENVISDLKANSYFKIRGTALNNMPLFLEAQVLQGSINLFTQTDGDEALKLNNIGQLFFTPFYPLNDGGSQPVFGHLRLGVETPYVNVTVYNWYARTKRHESGDNLFYYSTYRELDAWNGSLELTKDVELDGVNLEWFVALSQRPNWSGGDNSFLNRGALLRGIQSYVQATVGEIDYQVMYNVREVAVADLDYFFGNLNHQVALGAKGRITPELTFRFQAISQFFNADAVTITGNNAWQALVDDDLLDQTAIAVQADYATDMFGVGFKFQLDGDAINLAYFYGRNDGDEDAADVNNGLMTLVLNPWVQLNSDLRIGLDNTVKLDNPLGEAENSLSTDHKFYVNYDFLGVYAKFALAEVADEMEFSFNEVGITANLTDLVGMDLRTYAAFVMGGNNEIHLIADSQFSEDMGAALGILVRLEGDNAVAEGSEFGASAGFRMRVHALNSGMFFANFGYKAWLFDGDEKADRKIDGGRFDSNYDLGVTDDNPVADNMRLAIGMMWDF